MTIGTMRDRLIALAETVRDMGADRVMLTGTLAMMDAVYEAIRPDGEGRERWLDGPVSVCVGEIDGVRILVTHHAGHGS
jgi:hypothetical protein